MNKPFHFGAGPSMLPLEVLKKIKKEIFNWNNTEFSIMEINHRSREFFSIVKSCKKCLRYLLKIPKNYEILFCHGGARGQFAAIPMNLIGNFNFAEYVSSGHWSKSAIEEAKKYSDIKIIEVLEESKDGLKVIKNVNDWNINPKSEAAYIHYCHNETADGLSIYRLPKIDNKVIIADFSSSILTSNINVSKFGMIYASTQKNIGISGLALVIIRKDLLERSKNSITPSFLNYDILSKHQSIFNTPVIFTWYVSNLILKWIISQGGLKVMKKNNKLKSKIIYEFIDKSNFYKNNIHPKDRSTTNITFKLNDENLNKKFLKESQESGFHFLKGHKSIGGMRISLYNAMPIEGVKKLKKFMNFFANSNK